VLLLAVALRVSALGYEPMASDDAFTWRIVQPPLSAMFARIAVDTHPPLYYLMVFGWFRAFGDSLLALRAFSLLFGVLSVAAAWALGREATRLYGCGAWAGPAAGLLAALHAGALQASRFGRMYSLGAFLAALSTALLLRALREPRRPRWLAYALSAAAFAYVHYYAFFSLAAQLVLVAHAWATRRRSQPEAARRVAVGFGLACALAAALYAPWLPTFRMQAARVEHEYWVAPLRLATLAPLLAWWAAGLRLRNAAAIALLAVWSVLGAWVSLRKVAAARLLLTQAAIPWLAAELVSVLSGRPLVVERYLGFAQLLLLVFWGVAVASLPSVRARVIAASLVFAPVALGGWLHVRAYATGPSAERRALGWAVAQARWGDMLVTDSGRAMNRLRYMLHDMGVRGLPVYGMAQDGIAERIHAPALAPGDVHSRRGILSLAATRILWVAREPVELRGFKVEMKAGFSGPRGTRWLARVYVREGR
jgi:Dolichyl-phosphate-mannose-protein mannosyltransferase